MLKATDYIGSLILENDTLQFIQTAEGRVVPKTVDGVDKNEYQYHLKDHLGNVRTTFAVRDDDYSTDFETVDNPYFDNYGQVTRLSNFMKRSGSYSHRLTGGGTDIVGLMKTLYVSKGDKVSVEVFGKYLDIEISDDEINGGALINALVGMLGGGTLTGEGTVVQNNLNTDFISAAMADGSEEESPKAYLNYIVLDKNFNYVNSGFERLSESAADPGDGTATHQKLSFEEIAIEEDGYLMVFLSNESEQSVEVFWDDFRVDHHYNAVLQADDYYPFGLTFNSYKREFSKVNKMNTYQDQEYDEETGWVQFKWRNHMPELGRFFNVDPLAEKFYHNSPYAFAENKVTTHIELEGLEGIQIHEFTKRDDGTEELSGITYQLDVVVVTNSSGDNPSELTESDVGNIQSYLNSVFGGDHSDPESGVAVNFEFNISQLDKTTTKTKRNGKVKEISGDFSNSEVNRELAGRAKPVDDGTTSFPALVFGGRVPGTDGGQTGSTVKFDPNSKEGATNAVGHEITHFMLDRYGGNRSNSRHHALGGILGRPIGSSTINKAILNKLRENVPRSSKDDKR